MGIRIECCGSNIVEAEWVRCTDDFGFKNFFVSHAEFKAACCRDLGLVDPGDIDEICRKVMAEKTRQAANHAADVLAAASRRLA